MTSEARRSGALLAVVTMATLAVACADFSRGAPAGEAGVDAAVAEGGDGGALSFAADIEPLLVGSCATCHAAGKEAGDTGLLFTGDAASDRATVLPFVNTAAPASSRLVAKMSGANGHGGGTVFAAGTPEYMTVLDWIQGGAQP